MAKSRNARCDGDQLFGRMEKMSRPRVAGSFGRPLRSRVNSRWRARAAYQPRHSGVPRLGRPTRLNRVLTLGPAFSITAAPLRIASGRTLPALMYSIGLGM